MSIPLVQVDAFTDTPFAGNPAAVCLLPGPTPAPWMQSVAREMNLSETAFFRDENYIPYLHTVPIHLLPIKKSTYKNPKYADNAMISKWRPWVDMQEKFFRNDWIKPVLVTDWSDMQKPYLLEVNPLPGMKETSLLPMSARCIGLDFTALVRRMVEPALDRHRAAATTSARVNSLS
jgi:hypothetical protein